MRRPKTLALLLLACTWSGASLRCSLAQASGAKPPPGPPRTPAVQSADAAFRAGYAAFQRNDLAAARDAFAQAVRLAPKVGAGHSALGAVLLAQNNFSQAVHELQTATRLDAADASALLNLAVAYSDLGNFADSVISFHAYTSRTAPNPSGAAEPLPPAAALPLATALSQTGDLIAAENILRQALATSPDDPQLHDAVGAILAQKKQYPDAESEFRKAIALADTLPAAHYHLGSVLLESGQPADAEPELRRALSLEPGNIRSGLQLERALTEQNKIQPAIDAMRAMLARTPAPTPAEAVEVKYRLALALQASGDPKQALPIFADVLKARPRDTSALINTGLAHIQLGDAQGGIPLYQRALKLDPANATLHEDLGVAYLQQNDLDHALEQFRAGLAIDDSNPQLHYDLALALKLKDDLQHAIPEFQRAAVLDPALPDPPFTLGVIFMQQGKFSEAAQSLEKAAELRPDNGDAWATLGSVYRQLDQPDKAIPALRKAIALLPLQPSPHITLAAILAAQGHRDEAAAERKLGADLTRIAVSRQKADFALDSGNLLMKRGQFAEALLQFQNAVAADPGYAAAHYALATALEHAGRRSEADEERRQAAVLERKPAAGSR